MLRRYEREATKPKQGPLSFAPNRRASYSVCPVSLFDPTLRGGSVVLLVICLLIAFGFEFANGFHDTANAVATVIYTHSLKPRVAVALSAVFNFAGVLLSSLLGGIAVALAIVKLLPLELLVASGPGQGIAMVLALLLAAIVWNVSTWYLGLPASSSHTLIGAIVGVGLANSLTAGHHIGEGVNLAKVIEVGTSLLISPLFGFVVAYVLLRILQRVAADELLHTPPKKDAPPPARTRSVLIFTSCAVSFAHGQNDGQKGVGLVMLILMALAPGGFALHRDASGAELTRTVAVAEKIERTINLHADAGGAEAALQVRAELAEVESSLRKYTRVDAIPPAERFPIRRAILTADRGIEQLVKVGHLGLTAAEKNELADDRRELRGITEYAPWWVMVAIAVALGTGTMFGWKRIVITIGERIGKSQLTYAQGASAQLVAASTILLASRFGLPVSTTHVLSSGVAGTMVGQGSGLNVGTVRNIGLAWVLTLPASIFLSGVLFLLLRLVF
jgi:phosphate/sulfate permease